MVAAIRDVAAGKKTNAFTGSSVDASLCLSLVTKERTLDLIADSEVTRDAWYDGLRALVKFQDKLEAKARPERRNSAAGSKLRDIIDKKAAREAPGKGAKPLSMGSVMGFV